MFFNDFRKGRSDFTKEQLLSFIKRHIENETKSVNDNTLNNDISVFIRSYLKPSYKDTKIEIEEDFLSLMIDLDFMDLKILSLLIDLRKKVGHIQSEKASLIAGVIMIVFLFLGQSLLELIGIDVYSFAVAGSFILFFNQI